MFKGLIIYYIDIDIDDWVDWVLNLLELQFLLHILKKQSYEYCTTIFVSKYLEGSEFGVIEKSEFYYKIFQIT
jgi:hypothetical protein